jgi:glycerophosphoryl diester phosphodiesterase
MVMKRVFVMVLFTAVMAMAQYHGKGLIAHRGASAYAPENTSPSFQLAIDQGADYLEHDLQMTKDGVLVVLHDVTLERTTDVAKVFPERFRSESRGGGTVRHWYVYDFTLQEIKKLDAGAWYGEKFRGTRIPTWQELIDLARGKAGLYVETKGPETYDKLGMDMEKAVMDTLRKNGLDRPGADPKMPVLIQSFSAASIKRMKETGCKLPLQILFFSAASIKRMKEMGFELPPQILSMDHDKAEWSTQDGLKEAAKYAVGIAPEKSSVREDPELVSRAHKAGLTIAVWTFSTQETGGFPDVRDEMAFYLRKLNVDAVITNNPDKFPR